MKIAVVFGGKNAEREVSIKTKESVCKALLELSYDYEEMELNKDLPERIKKSQIDLVFNATHGTYGEDGRLAALLDIMEIPYTHSGFYAAAISMDKLMLKKIATELGIKVAKYVYLQNLDEVKEKREQIEKITSNSFVLKPTKEGSSVGVHIVKTYQNFIFTDEHFKYGPILIEEYISGKEIEVAIVNNKAIGAVEIRTKNEFYDYEAKYIRNDNQYIIPPELSDDIYKKVSFQSEIIHNQLSCNYLSRVDFLVRNEEVFFLEINTQPGFTTSSLVPKIATHAGIAFKEIVRGLIESASYN